MAAPPSSSSALPFHSPPLLRSLLFTPILELEKEEEEDEADMPRQNEAPPPTTPPAEKPYKHQPTPLHPASSTPTPTRSSAAAAKKPHAPDNNSSVSCNKCRPSAREKKISVVPLDINGVKHAIHSSSILSPSPNGIIKSIFSAISKRSPKFSSSASPASNSFSSKEEEWRLAATELSRKLLHVTKKRDEALSEASRLKYSMSELEKKLTKLENYCHDLKSSLESCNNISNHFSEQRPAVVPASGSSEFPVEQFLQAVSDARTAVRHLSRSLTVHIWQSGSPKVLDRISLLLQPYEVKVSAACKNPRSLLFYMEALLNRAFYEDFESAGFHKSGSDPILDPVARGKANLASYALLRELSWEEVLSRGTRHFSEGFSRFCDRKMSEVVGMLGWSRAWPEPLLQAFFGAAKGVWLVHLLAWSVHPALPIFRVEKGARFEPGYMDDATGERMRKLVPETVRMMVAPGFYVYQSVIKCKVLFMYQGSSSSSNGDVVVKQERAIDNGV